MGTYYIAPWYAIETCPGLLVLYHSLVLPGPFYTSTETWSNFNLYIPLVVMFVWVRESRVVLFRVLL